MGYIITEILGFIDYFGRLRPFTLFVELGLDLSILGDPLGSTATIFLESVSMYDLLVSFSIVSLILDFVRAHPDGQGDVVPDRDQY